MLNRVQDVVNRSLSGKIHPPRDIDNLSDAERLRVLVVYEKQLRKVINEGEKDLQECTAGMQRAKACLADLKKDLAIIRASRRELEARVKQAT
jgi:hypothetical protein